MTFASKAWFAAGVVTCVVMAPRDAHAYRPFDGTDADVAGLGEFELELGPVHYYGVGRQHYLLLPATVLNFGVFTGWEFVIDFNNFLALDPAAGQPRDQVLADDVFLKGILRRGVLQGETGVSVATEFGPLTPNLNGGDKGFGGQANLITSYRLGDATFHWNNAVALTRTQHTDLFSSMIVEGSRHLAIRPVGEAYVERDFGEQVTTLSGLLGAIWVYRDGLVFDVGLRVARELTESADLNVTEVRLGLTWTLPVWSPK